MLFLGKCASDQATLMGDGQINTCPPFSFLIVGNLSSAEIVCLLAVRLDLVSNENVKILLLLGKLMLQCTPNTSNCELLVLNILNVTILELLGAGLVGVGMVLVGTPGRVPTSPCFKSFAWSLT
jgi:hypothetical protein